MYLSDLISDRTCLPWLGNEGVDYSRDRVDEDSAMVWREMLQNAYVRSLTHLAFPLPAPPSDSELSVSTF